MGDMDTALGERAVRIPASGGAKLAADLALPQPAAGLVMVASCWRSPRVRRRTQPVVAALAECDFATLRLDLLTVEESARDELALVPGASHAEDRGAVDEVARLAAAWCQR